MSTVLSELTSLGLHRPGPGADRVTLAGWFDRLASVHEHLAAETPTPAEAAAERALADGLHARADRYRMNR